MSDFEKPYFHYGFKGAEHIKSTPVLSLKSLARAHIRSHISSVNGDTSIFPAVEQLNIPTLLKDYLKLYDVVPSNLYSIRCVNQR